MFIPPLLDICQRQIVLTPLLVEFSTQFSAQFESRWVLQTTHTGVADLEANQTYAIKLVSPYELSSSVKWIRSYPLHCVLPERINFCAAEQ